jgi:hypothetical protein
VTAEAIRVEAERQRTFAGSSSASVVYESQTVCANQTVAGWIKTNDSWNPTTCGNPSSIIYNVWTIERYDNMAIGSVMTACTGAVPGGWAMINSSWNPTTCGHPTSIMNNVMTIKRLS